MPLVLDSKQYKQYLRQESDFNSVIQSVSDSFLNAKNIAEEGRFLEIYASYFYQNPNIHIDPKKLKSFREENIEIFYFPKENPIKKIKNYEIYKIRIPKYKNQLFGEMLDERTAKAIHNNKYLWKKINSLGFKKIRYDKENKILVMYS